MVLIVHVLASRTPRTPLPVSTFTMIDPKRRLERLQTAKRPILQPGERGNRFVRQDLVRLHVLREIAKHEGTALQCAFPFFVLCVIQDLIVKGVSVMAKGFCDSRDAADSSAVDLP